MQIHPWLSVKKKRLSVLLGGQMLQLKRADPAVK